jgi:UDP-N-acetylmuramyl pentapeptide phosphotransferase/UDP-N-acetylglucosamine-1-phosphate transferase
MDGIDGIAGGQAVIASVGWAVLGTVIGSPDVIVLGALAAAAVSGFLIYNWAPAKVFMGDAGSAFLGFLFAAMPLVAAGSGPGVMIWAALLLWPFLFDTGFTLVRRIRRREHIFRAHRSHLYQRLTITGLPHSRVTALYGALALIGVAGSIGLALRAPAGAACAAVGVALSAWALWRYVTWREVCGVGPSPSPLSTSN